MDFDFRPLLPLVFGPPFLYLIYHLSNKRRATAVANLKIIDDFDDQDIYHGTIPSIAFNRTHDKFYRFNSKSYVCFTADELRNAYQDEIIKTDINGNEIGRDPIIEVRTNIHAEPRLRILCHTQKTSDQCDLSFIKLFETKRSSGLQKIQHAEKTKHAFLTKIINDNYERTDETVNKLIDGINQLIERSTSNQNEEKTNKLISEINRLIETIHNDQEAEQTNRLINEIKSLVVAINISQKDETAASLMDGINQLIETLKLQQNDGQISTEPMEQEESPSEAVAIMIKHLRENQFSDYDRFHSNKFGRLTDAVKLLREDFMMNEKLSYVRQVDVQKAVTPFFIRQDGDPKNVGYTKDTIQTNVNIIFGTLASDEENKLTSNT